MLQELEKVYKSYSHVPTETEMKKKLNTPSQNEQEL